MMQRTMQHISIYTATDGVYISQPIDDERDMVIEVHVKQINTLVDWLIDAKKEVESMGQE